jgi:hypothetical protein
MKNKEQKKEALKGIILMLGGMSKDKLKGAKAKKKKEEDDEECEG